MHMFGFVEPSFILQPSAAGASVDEQAVTLPNQPFFPSVLVFFEDLDAITRSRPFFKSELVLSRHSWHN